MYINSEDLPKDITDEILHFMEEAGNFAISEEGIDENMVEVSLTFVSAEEIRSLNRQFRGKDSETDVLSFPQFEPEEEVPEDMEIILGDVVICTDVAKSQAEEYGHSFQREVVYLFVHSICHLLGYDHMEDDEKEEMRAKEERAMKHVSLERI